MVWPAPELELILEPDATPRKRERASLRSEIDFEAWCRHVRSVDAALATLCNAIDDPKPTDPPLDRLARHAFMAVLALAQVLSGAYSEHARTSATLDSRSSRSASCSTRSSRT